MAPTVHSRSRGRRLRRCQHQKAFGLQHRSVLIALASSALLLDGPNRLLSFATPASWTRPQPRGTDERFRLCGHTHSETDCRRDTVTAVEATATMPAPSMFERINPFAPKGEKQLTRREIIRLYRTLGLAEDANRDQILWATSRLRKKYADDAVSLERVERANLQIMMRIVDKKEKLQAQRQQMNRMRELGKAPKNIFMRYFFKYLPATMQEMIEQPSASHFKRASGLIGMFALLGLCVPTQSTNFIGLGAMSALGFVYQRNRPEPVRDEMGNVGRVSKMNPKEMGATLLLVAMSGIVGVVGGFTWNWLTGIPWLVACCTACCGLFWLTALFFKVYGVFGLSDEFE